MGNGNNGSKGGNLLSRVAYSFGNVGQSAFYNALSTYFIVYVTSSLFSGVDKSVATKLIGIITGLVVVIRIAEIFIDRCWATSSTTPTPSGVASSRGSSSVVPFPPSCWCSSTLVCSVW